MPTGRIKQIRINLYFDNIRLIVRCRLLSLLSLEQLLNMLLAGLLALFTLNKGYKSFNRFFDLSVSRSAHLK